ncbi:hypothetical protein [Streptomyces antimycoticus]|uniref:hypothetical protein n=1 Tax=Streptomyces antimycoticus TaxID=68175 RepID=UPI0033F2267C
MFRRRTPPARSGPVDLAFTAASAEGGYRFDVHATGQWLETGAPFHQNPAAAAACHVLDRVTELAAVCSVLSHAELEYRANALLGQPADLASASVRVQWVAVHVHARPEDLIDAQTHERLRAKARAAQEEQQLRVAQYVGFRDLLREDPTIALAQLLLENPAAFTPQTVNTMGEIARQVASHAPGAAWVETARLLEKSFGGLPADAQQFIVDRLCTVLMEFGAKAPAERLRTVHRVTEAGDCEGTDT